MVEHAKFGERQTEADGGISDAELLRRYAAEGSESAFAELVRRYLDLVYSAALRQVGGDTHAAQDVAQNVFTTLARKSASLVRHPALIGWLYTSTHLAALKVRRTEGRRRQREQNAHLMNEAFAESSAEIDWDALRPVLDGAMRELRERDREAVLLRYFAQRPFAEIGAVLNVSEDGARMRVDRAVEKLRELLARRGITSSGAALALALTNQAVAVAPSGLAAAVTGVALSGATAATTVQLLYYMSTTKFISSVAAAAVILGLGGIFYEMGAARKAQAALDLARRDHAAQLGRLRATEAKTRAGEQDIAQLQQSLDELHAAVRTNETTSTARPPNTGTSETRASGLQKGSAFLAAHPAVKQALVDRSRARVASAYYSMYAKLRMAPEQIERFETLMIEGMGWSTDTPQTGPLHLAAGIGMPRNEVERELRKLLGDQNYEEFQQTTRAADAQQFTTSLASALYFTLTPLTARQAEVLGQLLNDSPRLRGRLGTPIDWDQLIQRTRGLLSEPQVSAIDRIRVQEEFITMRTRSMMSSR